MDNAIPILGHKPKICKICGQRAHPFNTKCSYPALVERIKKLLEANRTIPSLLQANSDAIKTANTFKMLLADSAGMLDCLEKVVKEHAAGDEIWKNFMTKLEDWKKEKEQCRKTSSPDTGGELGNSNPENTTPSETESKQCTEETPPGETTAPGSSQ